MLDVNQTLLLDFRRAARTAMEAAADHQRHPRFAGAVRRGDRAVPPDLGADNPCSIASSCLAARENARIIREVISAEMWERLNYYYLWMQGPRRAQCSIEHDRSEFYSQIKRINQLIYGIGEGTMSHGEAWEFFRSASIWSGLPDGAHPRRQVPHPAADAGRTSARRSTTPTGSRS